MSLEFNRDTALKAAKNSLKKDFFRLFF